MNAIQPSGGCATAAPAGSHMNMTQAGGGCCGPAVSGPSGNVSTFLPPWFGNRRNLIIGAIAVGGVGLAFGWPSLVALGVAPILLSLLPCAVMCAAGVCMMGRGMKTTPSQGSAPEAFAGTLPSPLLGIEHQQVPSASATSVPQATFP